MRHPSISGFAVRSVIGQGGMGTVYCAVRGEDSTLVALKVLHPHLAAVPEFVKRFHREARVAEKLAHPRVARVLTSGEERGTHYIVMELVRGEKLSQRLARDARRVPLATLDIFKGTEFPEDATTEVSTPLPADAVIKMMRQIATVLEEARQIGLVHRDIKPDNIIVDNNWNVKLLDFGIAKDTKTLDSVLSQTGQTFGTPPYMSPEQCKAAKDIDTRSDLYSLGVVAYHCLSGHTPFPGPTTAAFINQHINEIPRLLHQANPKIPKNLSQVVSRLLAKDPKDRHQTPNELIEDLNRVERGERPLKIYHPKKNRAFSAKQVVAVAAVSAAIVILSVLVILYGETAVAYITRQLRELFAARPPIIVVSPEPSKEEERRKTYNQLLSSGDEKFAEGKYTDALKSFKNAKETRETDEIKKRIAETELAIEAEQRLTDIQALSEQKKYKQAVEKAKEGEKNFADTLWAQQFSEAKRLVIDKWINDLLTDAQKVFWGKQWDVAIRLYDDAINLCNEALSIKDSQEVRNLRQEAMDLREKARIQKEFEELSRAVAAFKAQPALSGDSVRSVCFSRDSSRIASGSEDKTIRLRDTDTGKELGRLTGHQKDICSVCLSPDGSRIASGSEDKTIKLWNLGTGNVSTLSGHNDAVLSVCFSPDGKTLASGSRDKTVKLWNLGTGDVSTLSRHNDAVLSVCFSPDGLTIASGSSDGTIKLWDVKAGKERRPPSGHASGVLSVCFSPNNRILASGSYDCTIKLWDVETGKELHKLSRHQGPVFSVCFSPDSPIIASGSADKTIKLWHTASGRELPTLEELKELKSSVLYVCFSSDGSTIASGSEDGTVKLWGEAKK